MVMKTIKVDGRTYAAVEALKDLLGIKSKFPDILDVIAEVLKCFPERYTLDDIYDMLYKKDLGL